MKTEITKIKLQLKDREIELTAQEAREIHAELGKLFDLEKSTTELLQKRLSELEKRQDPMPAPCYPPPTPIIIEQWPERFPPHYPWWYGPGPMCRTTSAIDALGDTSASGTLTMAILASGGTST